MVPLFLYIYIFVASWGGTLTLGPWFPVHVISLFIVFILSLPQILVDNKFPRNIYHFEDLFIWIGIMAITFSGILNPNEKTLNYLLAYFYTFGIGYFALKYLLYKKISINKLFNVNTIAVLLVAGFAVIDIALYSFFGLSIRESLPGSITAPQTYHGNVSRAYGLSIEPAYLAYYLNTMGPLAFWKLWNYKPTPVFLKFLLSGLLILIWICTFSAAGIVFLIIGIIIALVLRLNETAIKAKTPLRENTINRDMTSKSLMARPFSRSLHIKNRNIQSAWIKLLVLVIILVVVFFCIEEFESIKEFALMKSTLHKIKLKGDSASIRMDKWNYALANIGDKPFFGKGIGYLSSISEGSSHNWYLFLTLEAGFIATGSFVLFLFLTAIRILKSKTILKYWFLAGFLAGALHLCVISTIHEPGLWILIALFNVVEQKAKEQQISV